ncbi:uncharacterized protein LOC122394566 [Amphibalanus amphitrite]|uniref:uncharacterized protein LOC122394566 n=1 Tax=Amphibalanus amphitrite TaxID=1232801 RepID=UPI001C908586|nr:uncharacterized protein LOC122394566 [Amphibalanus amphitrite]
MADSEKGTDDCGPETRSSHELRLTEKGREYQTTMKVKVFKQVLGKLEKEGTSLVDDLTSQDDDEQDEEKMTKRIAKWRHNYVMLRQTHEDLRSLLGAEFEAHRLMYDDRLTKLDTTRAMIESLTPQELTCKQKKKSRGARSSVTQTSRSSSSTDMKAQLFMMKVQENTQAAETKAKADALEERQELEREIKIMESKMQELKWKEEKHQIETERRIHKAKEEVIERMEQQVESLMMSPRQQAADMEMESHGTKRVDTDAQPTDCHEAVNDMTDYAVPPPTVPISAHCQAPAPAHPQSTESAPTQVTAATLADILSLQAQRCQLPPTEPGVFKGDHTTFRIWLNAFETYIETRCSSSSERLHYLGYYTAGEARNAITGFLQMGTADAYQQAKKRLTDRYGNAFVTMNEMKRRLQRWPDVRAGDSKSFTELSDYLELCLASSNAMGDVKMFGGPSEIDAILKKLPRYLSDSWRRIVDRWIYEPEEGSVSQYPPFAHFVQFMSREARVASGPVLPRSGEEDKRVQPKQRNARVLLTSAPTDQKPQDSRAGGRVNQQHHCVACKNDHPLDRCSTFTKMSLKGRQELVRQHGLCGGCLRKGHRWKECRRKQRCTKCSRLHPTLLHDDSLSLRVDKTTTQGTQTSAAVSLHVSCDKVAESPKCTHSMLVPVNLTHRDLPHRSMTVYALLDPQSDTCFVKESVLQELDLRGEDVTLEVSTIAGRTRTQSQVVHGLVVKDHKGETEFELPPTYSKADIPAERQLIPRRDTTAEWPHLQEVAGQLPEYVPDAEVGILIGINCPRALKPLEVVTGGDNDPWAIRTSLGWSVIGFMGQPSNGAGAACLYVTGRAEQEGVRHFAFRVRAREVPPEQLARLFDSDFTSQPGGTMVSQDDLQFIEIMKTSMHQRPDGRFEAPLPLRDQNMSLPDNFHQAQARLQSLKRKLLKDSSYREAYITAIKDLLDKGYAEPVPQAELEANDGRVWYVPHHGVVQPKKGKLRVVFDCSVEFRGRCLNHELLQGPNVSNNLVGILARFRKEPVALTCDIEAMFNRVAVTASDRNLLRFLWWPRDDVNQEAVCYRMTTHLFGAVSSPACAMHALNLTAELYEPKYGKEAANFVKNDFYVDDGLTSTPDAGTAATLIEKTTELCAEGGFKLTKFACNDFDVMQTVPIYSRSKTLVGLTFEENSQVCEQALGVRWDLGSDTIQFRAELPDRPATRRGILSGVSSLYDPLGLISPVILKGKMIVKELCGRDCSWDDPVPEELKEQWLTWKAALPDLSKVKIPRQYGSILDSDGSPATFELHHFSDASTAGYGTCSYLRVIKDGEVSSDLVLSKARVTPKKTVTVPRLELAAAVLATEVGEFLQQNLNISPIQHHYWCDSRVVLGYIRNNVRRFHVYVANRVQTILNRTTPSQWHFVPSEQNPSDLASRGCLIEELIENDLWWHGPPFLSCQTDLPLEDNEDVVDQQDPEVKKGVTMMASSEPATEHATLLQRLERFSTWFAAKTAVANCRRYIRKLKEACRRRRGEECSEMTNEQLTVQDLVEAETVIVKALQKEAFADELRHQSGADASIKKSCTEDGSGRSSHPDPREKSSLKKLDPLTRSGILCVGGRIRRANLPREVTNPVILPKKSHVGTLIIRQCHERTGHAGREMTLGELRQQGYWILHGRSAVSSYINSCVTCRKLRGPPGEQKMADLPVERLEPSPPFTYCGMDCFGPFYVKERRSQLKRWGIVFICLASRAVHLETLNSMTTDAFLNAYRRFVCRRGPVRGLFCDNGTNFVGGQNALKAALAEMDEEKIKNSLLKDQCDFINFTFNPPHASHMGGVWERLIRCARSVLTSLLVANGEQLDDELLRTLMCEVEDILNSRPISIADMSPTNQLEALSPSSLLTQKCRVVLPFPGRFATADVYARQRWRRVQHLANVFWNRWRKEVVLAAQERRKWTKMTENVEVGDVVLVMDDERPRSQWPLARVVNTYPGSDGLVRKVRVLMNGSEHRRPVHRLVTLLRAAPGGSATCTAE